MRGTATTPPSTTRSAGMLLLGALLLLAACRAETATALSEQDAQILAQLQADLGGTGYGLEPLLLHDDTRVIVQDDVAYLDYPDQPDDPRAWTATECFISAYAARRQLLADARVRDVALGLVTLPSGLQGGGNRYHVAAWVTFRDGHTETVDLTPLAADPIGPRYDTDQLARDQAELDDQFQRMRRGVSLDKTRAMLLTRRDGQLYYLLVSVLVLEDEYQFTLYGHRVQPATRERSLQIDRSAVVALRFKRSAFREVQPTIIEDGPGAFNARPHWLSRQGDADPNLEAVLDAHLYLLWHLVTKFREPGASAGGDLGIGPTSNIVLPLPADGAPVEVTVKANGYLDWAQPMTPTRSLELVVRMIKEP